MTSGRDQPKVFISYAHSDSQFVDQLAHRLKATGIDVWIDKWEIRVGDSIGQKISEGIEASDFLVVILSQASVASKWVKEELNEATIRNVEQEKHAFILPVLIEECKIPPLLAHRKYANFKDNAKRAFQELLEVIRPEATQIMQESLDVLESEIFESAETIKRRPVRALPNKGARKLKSKQVIPEMILIQAGEFVIGSDSKKDAHAARNEEPQHTIDLPDYFLSKTLITNLQYYAFVRNARYAPPNHWWVGGVIPKGKENHPVVYVSFNDAIAYCKWLSEITNKPYRIPTEPEWEKGARGTDGRVWPWGDLRSMKLKRKRYLQSIESGMRDTAPVEEHAVGASPYGLLDMAGNVWEWTASVFKPYPYDPDDGREEPREEEHLVVRGGAFSLSINFARCAYRMKAISHSVREDVGFRIALSGIWM